MQLPEDLIAALPGEIVRQYFLDPSIRAAAITPGQLCFLEAVRLTAEEGETMLAASMILLACLRDANAASIFRTLFSESLKGAKHEIAVDRLDATDDHPDRPRGPR